MTTITVKDYLYSSGSADASQKRKRAHYFMGAAGLHPLPREAQFAILRNFSIPDPREENKHICLRKPPIFAMHLAHTSVWQDDAGRAFVTAEPYPTDRCADILKSAGMPWIEVPSWCAPYGCGTTTYLFTFSARTHPEHAAALTRIEQALRLGRQSI